MNAWEVIFVGRKIGAIGITHTLPPIHVEAESREQAIEKARVIAYQEYEHISAGAAVPVLK